MSDEFESEEFQSRKVAVMEHGSGGQKIDAVVRERLVSSQSEFRMALVRYYSMEELMKQYPNFYFDYHGNFNNGSHSTTGYSHNNGEYDHLAPYYFAQMGKTLHRRYHKDDGIKDTWYYKVIDR